MVNHQNSWSLRSTSWLKCCKI